MVKSIGVAILAAGEGKRLKLNLPKPLVLCLGKRLVDYSLTAVLETFKKNKISNHKIGVVIGHQRELVKNHIQSIPSYKDVSFAVQEKQLGTADAIKSYFEHIPNAKDLEYTLIMCADTPVISYKEIERIIAYSFQIQANAVVATFETKEPFGYGRILKNDRGLHIVEEKDATDEERKITEVNSGLYFVKTNYLLEKLSKIQSNNKACEFYLTDIFQDHENVKSLLFEDAMVFAGVNTLDQLELIEKKLLQIKSLELKELGVRLIDSSSLYIDWDVQVGPESTLWPNVILKGNTHIGSNVVVEAGCIIDNCEVQDATHIKAYSYLESSVVKVNAVVGPFAHLRPGSEIGKSVKVGNFVEIKKAILHEGVKVSHLSYVGDAEIGEQTNIGCGFITCNYDGTKKHRTKIGANCFIGSDSQMIAPVELGDECYVASGSTINKNMPSGSFGIARERQVTKEGMSKKFLPKTK